MRPCIVVCAAVAFSAMGVPAWAQADATHRVPLFPSASDDVRQGFVRVVNRSGHSGDVSILALDDGGAAYGPLTLALDGLRTMHFNSDDLEGGNAAKGLSGSTGAGDGDWRLEITSTLDLEVLAYIRTADGFLTAMHDVAPVSGNRHRVAIFNPGSNANQVSRLRLVNPADTAAEVTITGKDDRGQSPGGAVRVTVPAGASRTLTAAELEHGGANLTGALGDGAGKWRLEVVSEQPIRVLSLLSSPTGHLTNLSTAPSNAVDGVHAVLVFPSAADVSGRQGFVRVINRSNETAEIAIRVRDDSARAYGPLTLTVPGGQVLHFNSDDLENGNAAKGLSGGTGAGEGDWRLELSSDSDIDVLAYIRTTDGFLTAMHDVAPASQGRHRVAIFNPGSNTAQRSSLRLVNTGDAPAAVDIVGVDDRGQWLGVRIQTTVPAGSARTYTAQALEFGRAAFQGALGDGTGKWRLDVDADRSVRVLSLLSSPTGHLTNLSTATARDDEDGRAEEAFRGGISAIVQSKCVNCHVAGGDSGNTRLVFVPDSDPDHLATNYQVFAAFVDGVDDGADLILDKIRGIDHGGGEQVAEDTDEYATMERFLELLAVEKVGLRVQMFGEGTVEVVDGRELGCDGRVCSSLVRTGRRVTLRATAARGYAFDGWKSCDRAVGNDCVVTVDRDRMVFADFLSTAPLAFEDDVVAFDRERLADIEEYDSDSGLMILRSDANLAGIAIGSVLASWVITDNLGFESYFLRRVTDLRHVAGSPAFLRTTQATLDDLIRSGSLSSSLPLGPDQVVAYELPPGVTPLSHRGATMKVTELPNGHKRFEVGRPKGGQSPAPAPVTASVGRKISFTIVDLKRPGVTVNGEVGITITHDFKLHWDFKPWSFGPKEVQATASIVPEAELTADVGAGVDMEHSQPLGLKLRFAPVAIGPVVVVPELSAYLDIEFKADARFKPELSWKLTVTAGAEYSQDRWKGIWSIENDVTFDPLDPLAAVQIGMEAGAGATIEFATKVYGVAGPFVNAGPYVRGEIVGSLNKRCNWNYGLYVGAKSNFGGRVEVLGFEIGAEIPLYQGEFPLRKGGRGCPEGAGVPPPLDLDAATEGWDGIKVSWTASNYKGSLPVSYEVEYYTTGGRAFDQVPYRTEVADTSYRLNRTTPGREYCFEVRTLIPGNESKWTERECVWTEEDEVPPEPVTVNARALSPTAIDLTWNASTDNWGVSHYSVRHLNPAGTDALRVDSAVKRRDEVTDLSPGTTYCYGVVAVDWAGNESERSDPACATTPTELNWRFRAACTGLAYRVEQDFWLDEKFGDGLFAFDDEAQDYDNVPSKHALTGTYDKAKSLLAGKVFWTFDDAAGVRIDTFEADLSSGDTDDIVTEKSGPGAGCDLVVRFDRLRGGVGSTTPPAVRTLPTGPQPGQETIRRRR